MFFDTNLKHRMMGDDIEKALTIDDRGIPMQYDFTDLYAFGLKGWFEEAEEKLQNIIQQAPGDSLDLFTS
jgi:hypothetical protein